MEVSRLRMSFAAVALLAFVMVFVLPSSVGAAQSPAPAPSSDGVAIDQGVAYLLMVLALVLTYIIH